MILGKEASPWFIRGLAFGQGHLSGKWRMFVKNGPTPRIRFEDVTVSFGAIRALKGISLEVAPGEVVGLLGHNGAGKSTLVNVACGVVPLSSGQVFVNGTAVKHAASPGLMHQMGIHVVHQDPAVLPNLTLGENLLLKNSEFGHRRGDLARAKTALRRVGLTDDLNVPTRALGMGGRQLLSIARGLLEEVPQALFLDEPAASLGADDAERLHSFVRELAKAGSAVVYVSHRLRDIVEMCSRYVVLRDGVVVEDAAMAGLTTEGLARALTGSHDLAEPENKNQIASSRPVVLSSSKGLQIREGEIVGLFGMAGGEQFQVLAQIFGMVPNEHLVWDGNDYRPKNPRDAISRGVHMVQADREADSLFHNLSARDNVITPWLGKLPDLRSSSPRNRFARSIYDQSRERLGIKGPQGEAPIDAFSGGNRQKHVLARWMVPKAPKLLLLAQPTQGIDEQSKNEIATALRTLAKTGVPILVASAESDEISRICDRAYVLVDNNYYPEESGPDFDARLLSRLLDRSRQTNLTAREMQ